MWRGGEGRGGEGRGLAALHRTVVIDTGRYGWGGDMKSVCTRFTSVGDVKSAFTRSTVGTCVCVCAYPWIHTHTHTHVYGGGR